ncbi:MAG: MCE family protein [Marichromatium sp.]|nr:MCE family protein [Marichromatium sp.]
MSETAERRDGAPALPEAEVRVRGAPSLVWLIPLLALAIGAWLALKTLSEQGPTITVRFPSAAGLQAGKTKVKFKDVEVGQVTAIDVSQDLDSVIVTAELKHGSAHLLNAETRFWVERPRVSASRVSGLETLLSGAFIALDPGSSGASQRDFVGLDEPPLFTTDAPGTRFVLRAATLGSLNIGSPVYYRQIQVGQVVGFGLEDDASAVRIELFIPAPHDALVSAETRFWNASGVDISLSGAGISLDTQSLVSVLLGGVAFDTPDTIAGSGAPAQPLEVFPLYPNREAAHARTYAAKSHYLLLFEDSVRGLSIGAPVMLRGIEIGQVLDIQLQFDPEAEIFRIPVLIEVEPERIALRNAAHAPDHAHMLERLVELGLRAQLKLASLITGQLYVELDIDPEAPAAGLGRYGDYVVIPSRPTPLEALTGKLERILSRLEQVPFEQIGADLGQTLGRVREVVDSGVLSQLGEDLEDTLASLRGLAEQLDGEVAPALRATLEEARATFAHAGAMLDPEAATTREFRTMLRETAEAARAVRDLADYLERHPEALIQGKGGLR